MVEQPAFGQRVRQLRRQYGLSQAALAGEKLSASYISLVEAGRRTPGPELAQAIADRLGVSLEELTAPDDSQARQGRRLDLVARLISANTARNSGDLAEARAQISELLARLDGPENDDLAWEARWTLATILGEMNEVEECERVLRDLLGHPFTFGSAPLHTRVAGRLAELARNQGRLEESIELAEAALAAATHLDVESTERVQVSLTMLMALTLTGERRHARPLAEDLLALAPHVASRPYRALIAWAVAGFRTESGYPAGALELLDRAFAEITPVQDLTRWTALCRSAAAIRLDIVDDQATNDKEIARLLSQAGQATELVGQPADRALLAGVETAAALYRGDLADAQARLAMLEQGIPVVAPLHQAGLYLVIGRVRAAAGELGPSVAAYRAAAERYQAAGAYKPAGEIWRELSGLMESGTLPQRAVGGWPAIKLP